MIDHSSFGNQRFPCDRRLEKPPILAVLEGVLVQGTVHRPSEGPLTLTLAPIVESGRRRPQRCKWRLYWVRSRREPLCFVSTERCLDVNYPSGGRHLSPTRAWPLIPRLPCHQHGTLWSPHSAPFAPPSTWDTRVMSYRYVPAIRPTSRPRDSAASARS